MTGDPFFFGRVAVITGGAGAIGSACVRALASAGADVVINHFGTRETAESLEREIAASGRHAFACHANVADEAEVEALFAETDRRFGRVDFLVNCAGIARSEDIYTTTLASWNEILAVNLTGPFLTARAAMRRMRLAGFGRIVNIASVVAHRGHLLGQVHYGASKAGLIGLTKTLARTGAADGITVNAVAPGIVDTPLLRKTHTPEEIAMLAKRAPIEGLLSAADVAAAVLYLCGEGARYVTGACIDVDGGERMR